MKRSILKLVIRHETLRVLAGTELVHIAGGDPAARLFDTGGAETGCPLVKAVAPGSGNPGTGCKTP